MGSIIAAGKDTLAKTPDMLPVLKKAGVVDAGGKGLVIFFKGMLKGILGEELYEESAAGEEVFTSKEFDEHADLMELDEIEYAYCTEFFIINLHKKTTGAI